MLPRVPASLDSSYDGGDNSLDAMGVDDSAISSATNDSTPRRLPDSTNAAWDCRAEPETSDGTYQSWTQRQRPIVVDLFDEPAANSTVVVAAARDSSESARSTAASQPTPTRPQPPPHAGIGSSRAQSLTGWDYHPVPLEGTRVAHRRNPPPALVDCATQTVVSSDGFVASLSSAIPWRFSSAGSDYNRDVSPSSQTQSTTVASNRFHRTNQEALLGAGQSLQLRISADSASPELASGAAYRPRAHCPSVKIKTCKRGPLPFPPLSEHALNSTPIQPVRETPSGNPFSYKTGRRCRDQNAEDDIDDVSAALFRSFDLYSTPHDRAEASHVNGGGNSNGIAALGGEMTPKSAIGEISRDEDGNVLLVSEYTITYASGPDRNRLHELTFTFERKLGSSDR